MFFPRNDCFPVRKYIFSFAVTGEAVHRHPSSGVSGRRAGPTPGEPLASAAVPRAPSGVSGAPCPGVQRGVQRGRACVEERAWR